MVLVDDGVADDEHLEGAQGLEEVDDLVGRVAVPIVAQEGLGFFG